MATRVSAKVSFSSLNIQMAIIENIGLMIHIMCIYANILDILVLRSYHVEGTLDLFLDLKCIFIFI